MKKIISLMFIIVLLLSLFNNISYAEETKSFTIMSSTNSNYSLELFVMNGSTVDLSDVALVDQPLRYYIIKSVPKYCGDIYNGKLEWENPDYKIIEGSQNVNLLLKDYASNSIINTFVVCINGKQAQEKITPTNSSNKLYGGRKVTNYTGYVNDSKKSFIPHYSFLNANGEIVSGTVTYTDFDNTTEGKYDVTWTFTPDNNSYETVTGIVKITIEANEDIVKSTTPTLTASTLLLSEKASYDINVNNKPSSGASYKWTSSNTGVAKVAKNGLVTAIETGETTITCEVTDATGLSNVLSAEVTVGTDDDNSPTLDEDNVTIEVGEVFDIDATNTVKGCIVKYKSSDITVAKVNSISGKITGIGIGKTTVTCTITNTDNSVVVLNANVTVE